MAAINYRLDTSPPDSVFSGQDAIDQLVEDWSVVPFIELRVEQDACTDGYEPVFETEWHAEQACEVKINSGSDREEIQVWSAAKVA